MGNKRPRPRLAEPRKTKSALLAETLFRPVTVIMGLTTSGTEKVCTVVTQGLVTLTSNHTVIFRLEVFSRRKYSAVNVADQCWTDLEVLRKIAADISEAVGDLVQVMETRC